RAPFCVVTAAPPELFSLRTLETSNPSPFPLPSSLAPPVRRRIGLLPGAHSTVNQPHVAVHVLGGVADQVYGAWAADFRPRYLTVRRMQFHPAPSGRVVECRGGQGRVEQPGGEPVHTNAMRGE